MTFWYKKHRQGVFDVKFFKKMYKVQLILSSYNFLKVLYILRYVLVQYSMNMIITTWTFIKDVNVVHCSAIEQKMNLF